MPGFQSTRGEWSGVFDWPIIGIHCILTPDGKILTYGTDQFGQQGGQLIYDVWDIATNTHYTLPNTTPTDMFCSAAAVVPESGQILIMGGDSRAHDPTHVNFGVHDANVFDPATMTVSPLDEDCAVGEIHDGHICGGHMQFERWYPTAITLASGKIVVLGGQDGQGVGVATPELYTPDGGWRTLDGATSSVIKNDWWYPRAWLDADGMVNIFESTSTAGQPGKVMLMDPSGDGRITVVGTLPFATTTGANPAIMYEQNKVLALADNGDAWIMNMSGEVPTFTKTASLGESRLWSNMVVLADGSVMVSGGSGVENQLTGVTNEVAIWNPSTGQWKIGADAAVARLYHSTTILLPDATVLSLGGGAPGPLTNTNGEIYSPPYLFDQDGNLAKRPVISTAPSELKPGATFTISVDDALSVDRLTFVKDGAVTHSLNMAASKVELAFTAGPNNKLTIQLPENSNVLTPGNWMLFAINNAGTPSIASTIKIDVGGELRSEQMGGWITLNGNAAHDVTTDTFILTQDAPGQKGAVMSNERIDLRSDFDISFNIYLGAKDAGGADGMAFVLHNDPFGGDATGGGGGFYGASGIRYGVGLAFDTYQNATWGEIANDHTNFFRTDAPIEQARLSGQVDLGNVEDGNWHSVNVSWDVAQHTLSYTFDGKQAGSLTGDLASQYFAGFNYAYFGFTAGTGGLSNPHQVKINSLDAVLEDGTRAHFSKAAVVIPGLPGGVALNGNAHYDDVSKIFTLTADAPGQTGDLMSNARLDLRSDFDISFNVYLGTKDAAGADGMAFVLHNDPSGADAIGDGGGWFGAAGLRNGLGIEFDTYQNATFGDIANDHTNIFKTDAPFAQARLSSQVDLANIEDGNWHQVHVAWDAAQQRLSYAFDGQQAGALTGNLASQYFAGNFAYFGFTAGTGGLSNPQQVEITGLDAVLEDGTRANFGKPSGVIPGVGGSVTLNGTAHYDGVSNVFTLTADAPGQTGGLMSNERLDLRFDFDISFNIYLGAKDAAGADGMAFVLHNDPLGADAIGDGGGWFGAAGIRNGLGIEFDTYQNATFGDIANDHTNFFKTDAPFDQARLSSQVNLANIEDGNWHQVHVAWDAAQQRLSYAFDGQQAGALTGDLASQYFAGNFAYFGFTAGTGGLSNPQQLEITGLDAILQSGTHVTLGPDLLL